MHLTEIDAVDRVRELLQKIELVDKGSSAACFAVGAKFFGVLGRHQHDPYFRETSRYEQRCVEAVELGHLDIHEQQLWLQSSDNFDCVYAVRGNPDNLNFRI